MKRIILSCVGLVGLSAATGLAIFASHSAMAAGPRLPERIVLAHAVAASKSSQAVAVSFKGEAENVAEADVSGQERFAETRGLSQPVVSTQQAELGDGLAPYRTLRPVSRDDGFVNVAQAAVTTRSDAQVVSSNRRITTRVAFEPERRPLIQRIFQPRSSSVSARPDPNAFTASGMHGVFR
ncbi:hypothetical protein [Sagittula stellata]